MTMPDAFNPILDAFNPVKMGSLWKVNEESLGNAETAFRTWLDYSSRLQEHAMKFMSGRLAKDTAAVAQLRNCKSPMDAFSIQVDYLAGAYSDFMSEGQKVVGFFSDVARESMAGAAAKTTSSTGDKAKHARHPASAH